MQTNSAQNTNSAEVWLQYNKRHLLQHPGPMKLPSKPIMTDQERKHVTVLFSDLSGYTAMTEKMDPEEVKEIIGQDLREDFPGRGEV